jgi:hypothetical protein
VSEYESLMNISLNAVLRSNADNPDMTLSPMCGILTYRYDGREDL